METLSQIADKPDEQMVRRVESLIERLKLQDDEQAASDVLSLLFYREKTSGLIRGTRKGTGKVRVGSSGLMVFVTSWGYGRDLLENQED